MVRPRHLAPAIALAALLALAACGVPARPDTAPHTPVAATTPEADPLRGRVLAELDGFVTWLERHDVEGYVGEVGWPAGPDAHRWNALAGAWLAAAQEAGLWVTVWGAGAWWGTDYPLSPYVASDGTAIDTPAPQAATIEASTGGPPLGVTVSGAEFGAPGGTETHSTFSNARPGVHGIDYAYEPAGSFRYLAGRGLTLVRLPFRWERVQPEPYAPLAPAEVERLRATVRAAGAEGLEVVVGLHNYGGYLLADGDGAGVRRAVGSRDLPISAFADLWARLSAEFAGEEAVVAYGLMNEPQALASTQAASAWRWERASQAAVDAVRGRGDTTLVMVSGANWSAVRGWADTHPEPWIDDPAGNVRYQAHHYFDTDGSGRYEAAYATERSRAATAQEP